MQGTFDSFASISSATRPSGVLGKGPAAPQAGRTKRRDSGSIDRIRRTLSARGSVCNGWKAAIAKELTSPHIADMMRTKRELDKCLADLEQLALNRLEEGPPPHLRKQYEMVAANAAKYKEAGKKEGWPHMGEGAGLGFGRGLGDWTISDEDRDVMRLAYRIDDLHRTGVIRSDVRRKIEDEWNAFFIRLRSRKSRLR